MSVSTPLSWSVCTHPLSICLFVCGTLVTFPAPCAVPRQLGQAWAVVTHRVRLAFGLWPDPRGRQGCPRGGGTQPCQSIGCFRVWQTGLQRKCLSITGVGWTEGTTVTKPALLSLSVCCSGYNSEEACVNCCGLPKEGDWPLSRPPRWHAPGGPHHFPAA